MSTWYWQTTEQSEPQGPVSASDLKKLALAQQINRNDFVWKQGMQDWVQAYQLKGLFDSPPASPVRLNGPPKPPASTTAAEIIPATTTTTQARDAGSVTPTKSPGLTHSSESDASDRGIKNTHRIAGWLALFCIGRIVLGPLITFGNMVNDWEASEPAFDIYPIIKSALILENTMLVAIVIYGFIVGVMLQSRPANGKAVALKYLKISLWAFIVVELGVLLLLSGQIGSAFSTVAGSVTRAIIVQTIVFGLWISYFKKSRRVAATFVER